jgi:hypothetical protein
MYLPLPLHAWSSAKQYTEQVDYKHYEDICAKHSCSVDLKIWRLTCQIMPKTVHHGKFGTKIETFNNKNFIEINTLSIQISFHKPQ